MKKEDKVLYYKEEFIKRYKYLYENSEYILAPFMHEETKEEIEKRNAKYKELDIQYKNENAFISLSVDKNILLSLEELLLSEGKLEDNPFYQKLEYLKGTNQHYADVEYGLSLVEKKNIGCPLACLEMRLDLWKLLSEVRDFILDQSGDEKNKNLKLEVLDEYFRVNRYSNDGKVWTSGFKLTIHDVCNYNNLSMVVTDKENVPNREKNDIGVMNNGFINFFGNTSLFKNRNNAFHFSEKEKQDIYLNFHDELPWDLEVLCAGQKLEPSASLEVGYPVLNNPLACGSSFRVKEEDIFVGEGKFYQLCPECGYMVQIPSELINERVQKRIIDRHEKFVKQLKK